MRNGQEKRKKERNRKERWKERDRENEIKEIVEVNHNEISKIMR